MDWTYHPVRRSATQQPSRSIHHPPRTMTITIPPTPSHHRSLCTLLSLNMVKTLKPCLSTALQHSLDTPHQLVISLSLSTAKRLPSRNTSRELGILNRIPIALLSILDIPAIPANNPNIIPGTTFITPRIRHQLRTMDTSLARKATSKAYQNILLSRFRAIVMSTQLRLLRFMTTIIPQSILTPRRDMIRARFIRFLFLLRTRIIFLDAPMCTLENLTTQDIHHTYLAILRHPRPWCRSRTVDPKPRNPSFVPTRKIQSSSLPDRPGWPRRTRLWPLLWQAFRFRNTF